MSNNNTMAALQSAEVPTCSKCSVNSGCGLNFKCMHSVCLECLQNLSVDDQFINCNICQVDASSTQLSAEHSVFDASSVADHVLVDEDFIVKLTTKGHSGNTEYYEGLKITCKLTLPSSDPVVEKYLIVEDSQNGTYILSGCCDVVGKWELSCYFNGVQTRQSPFKVNVVKGGLQDHPNLFRERTNAAATMYMFDIVGDAVYACGGSNEVTKFTLKGKLVGTIYGPASCQFTSLCCANAEDALSIVCYNAHTKFLMIYKKENWHEWQNFQIQSVMGKMISHGDKVYVPDYEKHCVFCFSLEGDLLWKIEGTHYKKVNITFPIGITITQKGDMLVLSYNDLQVVEFDNQDHIAEIWLKNTKDETLLSYPYSIAIDERGQIIIGSRKRLLLFNKEGKFIKNIENIPEHLPLYPYCVFSRNRRIWVADKNDSSLRIYNY